MRKVHKGLELHGFFVTECRQTVPTHDVLEWVVVFNDKSVTCKRCLKIMEKSK